MSRIRMPYNSTLRILAYVFMGLMSALGLWKVGEIANDARDASEDAQAAVDAVAQESDDRTVAICESTNQNRSIILQLVEQTASSGGTDFEKVPGFAELDPAMQDYLLNLNAPRDPGDRQSFVEIARELLKPDDCSKIGN